MLGPMLASIHNLHYYLNLMREIREALDAGRFGSFRADVQAGPGKRRLRVGLVLTQQAAAPPGRAKPPAAPARQRSRCPTFKPTRLKTPRRNGRTIAPPCSTRLK